MWSTEFDPPGLTNSNNTLNQSVSTKLNVAGLKKYTENLQLAPRAGKYAAVLKSPENKAWC